MRALCCGSASSWIGRPCGRAGFQFGSCLTPAGGAGLTSSGTLWGSVGLKFTSRKRLAGGESCDIVSSLALCCVVMSSMDSRDLRHSRGNRFVAIADEAVREVEMNLRN